ncbi:conserved hypothetical protein [Candida tropicalis MYA-3404]|uniref:RNase III domain-containing protein n=1 Tax=Candida tropicalis (strain ATCC MYA-3404 / T1) TaxID=294747 RepID=C5M831_CANTT|nr:conserved hypothetical protein [Candida tropicalis MYA-3404]EER33735.1 conserved hypothetical protein [Candida tropicalis MYA-3404]KAG4407582.1 hypothetical protein JTP64_003117 [Candida tropicalis]
MLSVRSRSIMSTITASTGSTTHHHHHHHRHSSSSSCNSKHSILIPSPLNNLLHSDKQIKYHFYSLGGDFIRLASYHRFKHLFRVGGGSLVKEVVFDLSTFLKRELNDSNSTTHQQLKDFLTSNETILKKEESMILCDHHFGLKNWLYIIFGYMLQTYTEEEVDNCLDRIIEMYLDARKNRISPNDIRIIRDEKDNYILKTFEDFITNVPIRNDLLYETKERYVIFKQTKDHKIYLPDLPRIQNKQLLVKALMHKEFYRILLDPNHEFAKKMMLKNYDLEFNDYGLVRKEISFLDGLGDLFLAQETSKLIYELCKNGIHVNSTTYQLLKMIFATNTLMSKLTKAYNLFQGLDDPLINIRISNEWLPYTTLGKMLEYRDAEETRIYEEEFLGDFFESYMAALLLEQPEVAKSFIREIYQRLSQVITETLPPDVTYQKWTIGILGRNIYNKKDSALL